MDQKRLGEDVPFAAPNPRSFGLCMIVKDCAHMIWRILDQIKPPPADYCLPDHPPHFDQVVIVDTGSTDGTVDLIKTKYPWVELYHFDWVHDFSAARNFAKEKLNTAVWMWLDADDTFSRETLDGWFRVAEDLAKRQEDADDPTTYALIPYYYKIDENDIPVIVQYRERIMGWPTQWEWREPLHEVCHYTGPKGGSGVSWPEFPVLHRPEDAACEDSGNRNWKILVKHYLDGDRSDRTLYYFVRALIAQRQWEFAVEIGKILIARDPGGYYEYECLVALGDAYAAMYKRDDIEDYKAQAIKYLNQATRFDPLKNDSRVRLCDLHIHCEEGEEALAAAKGLNTEMPLTVATTVTSYYGTYKHAVMAAVYMKLLDDPYQALQHHMKACDTRKPHEITFELEKSIRAYIKDANIGIVYCDEKYNGHALACRTHMVAESRFKEVWAFNDPRCVGYANGVYIHFTEKLATLYREDGHPRLRKFLIVPPEVAVDTVPYGYESVFLLAATPSEYLPLLQEKVFSTVDWVVAEPVNSLVDTLCAVRTPFAAVGFDPDTATRIGVHEQINPTPANRVRMYVDSAGYVAGLSGPTDNLVTLYIDCKGVLRVPKKDTVDIVLLKDVVGDEYAYKAETPTYVSISTHVESYPTPNKRVVFAAPGIEEWDGTTPRRWGIGASESSLVYVAEELVKRGHKVTVYTTVSNTRYVAGVAYAPESMRNVEGADDDLLVSSRMPEVLEGPRRAKRQVLWMHDVAEAYLPRLKDTQTIDRYLCVSDWQKDRAAKANFKQSKLRVVPNGILRWPRVGVDRVHNRSVWLSQPERGLQNLYEFWGARPELFNDVWVVYGFYNMLNYRKQPDLEAFRESCRHKNMLRAMGAKIVGRIPHQQVQALSQTAERWVYPSCFPETFCVAGLEAYHNGCRCYVTHNGATLETLKKADGGQFSSRTPVGRVVDMSEPNWPVMIDLMDEFRYTRDAVHWLQTIDSSREPLTEFGLVDEGYYWDSIVANQWEDLLNGK